MFGVYIHWPFCLSKCPYCDFNSHVSGHIDQENWRRDYAREIAYVAAKTADRIVTSIYFGGGTPSLMTAETVEFVINEIQKNWRMANDVEITLEANPTSIEREKFKDFKSAGINRVSVGVQALNSADLKFLGRQHSAEDACAALEIAYQTFERVSFDLIYARPGQSLVSWETELRRALSIARAGHLSLYQLTIEPGTAFETMYQRREFSLPEEDLGAALYEMTAEIAAEHGLDNYEISNYAKSGEESRHNLTYWRYQDYVGIGPGAHGRLEIGQERFATRARRAPKIWSEHVHTYGHGFHPWDVVSPQDAVIECLLMGLRLKEGVAISRLESVGGKVWRDVLDQGALQRMVDGGFMSADREIVLCATDAGRLRLNKVLSDIIV